MAQPDEASRPRLAPGCRWAGGDTEAIVLFPEGAIRLEGSARDILQHCDGQRSFTEIVKALQALYGAAGAEQIREDAAGFLEQLQQQRIVDY